MLNVGGTIFPVLRKYLQPDKCGESREVLEFNKYKFNPHFYKQLLEKNSPYKDHRLILGSVWETICSPNVVKDQHGNYIMDAKP